MKKRCPSNKYDATIGHPTRHQKWPTRNYFRYVRPARGREGLRPSMTAELHGRLHGRAHGRRLRQHPRGLWDSLSDSSTDGLKTAGLLNGLRQLPDLLPHKTPSRSSLSLKPIKPIKPHTSVYSHQTIPIKPKKTYTFKAN